jgi:ribosome recycling factor
MGSIEDTLAMLGEEISTAHEALTVQLKKLRTGRAHISLLDGIRVNYFGVSTPLSQCAQLSAADARLLTIKPWDRNIISDIEKAIMSSDLGVMPQNDGNLIRLPLPPLTEQRRRDLVKQSKQRGEDAKIGLRNHRRDANEMLKESEKSKKKKKFLRSE